MNPRRFLPDIIVIAFVAAVTHEIFEKQSYASNPTEWVARALVVLVLGGTALYCLVESIKHRTYQPFSKWLVYALVLQLCVLAALLPVRILGHFEDTPERRELGIALAGLLMGSLLARRLWSAKLLANNLQLIRNLAVEFVRDPRRTARASDVATTAAHEAGHALLYACLAKVPDALVADCYGNESEDSVGSVSARYSRNHIANLTYAEWRMMVCLGGNLAEDILIGHAFLGSNSDMETWEQDAKHYHLCGHGAFFYANPASVHEAAVNAAVLKEFRNNLSLRTRSFLEANRDLLHELALALSQHRRMESAALSPFLQRAVIPDGCPRNVLPLLPDDLLRRRPAEGL